MLTNQLIFLAILTVLFVLLFFRLLNNPDSRNTAMLLFLVVVILLSSLLSCVITIDELRQKAKGICPEYKKLENVYQLK